jgi:hypothetical protein
MYLKFCVFRTIVNLKISDLYLQLINFIKIPFLEIKYLIIFLFNFFYENDRLGLACTQDFLGSFSQVSHPKKNLQSISSLIHNGIHSTTILAIQLNN